MHSHALSRKECRNYEIFIGFASQAANRRLNLLSSGEKAYPGAPKPGLVHCAMSAAPGINLNLRLCSFGSTAPDFLKAVLLAERIVG